MKCSVLDLSDLLFKRLKSDPNQAAILIFGSLILKFFHFLNIDFLV